MRKQVRAVVIALIAFIAVGYFYSGFNYGGDMVTLLLAGGIFAILTIFIRPMVNILSLPFNLVTIGLFSFVVNIGMLFAITFVLPSFQVVAFDFPGATLSGFVIPAWHFTQIMAALLASTFIGLISTILLWLFN